MLKLSHPLSKSVRTLEGVLVLAANAALVVIPAATASMSAGTAVKYGVVLNGAYAIARSLLKGIAATGIPAAQLLSPDVQARVDQVAASVAGQAVQDAEHGASAADMVAQAVSDETEMAAAPPPAAPPPAAPVAPAPGPVGPVASVTSLQPPSQPPAV